MDNRKICILGATNLKHMTLVSLYTEVLKRENAKYDVIYIDRYDEVEPTEAENRYRFRLYVDSSWPFLKKLKHYWKFRDYAIGILEKEKYDFIIVWNEFTAFMFSDYLSRKCKGKYSINIRDYNYNNVFFVQYRLHNAVKNSAFSTISSERFREFLPKGEYLFVHSYNDAVLHSLQPVQRKKTKGEKIRLMFIGRLSYPESKHKMIDSIGNDERFEFWLVGAGCEELIKHVEEKQYTNIKIKGSFTPSETADYLQNADIIFSLNQENEIFSDMLLPIKLYHSIKLHIPILAYKSSYTYEYANKLGFAVGIEDKEISRAGDIIYEQYHKIKQEDIDAGCEYAMKDVIRTHKELEKRISQYILSKN